jgi:ethanolaminephosphotransferase
VRGLREYKYSGSDVSLFLTYVSNPIYNRIVLLFPLWLAPNVITLSGLMCTMLSYAVFQHYCPLLYGVAPWWAYVLNAASILGYQALDAMDGKQARRTGSGSPLGLLFDHGCDAFNGTIMSLTMCSVAQMGPGLVSLSMWVFATGVFFTATVEEFYTGEMRLGIINGPNEGLLIAVITNLITAAFGPRFWTSSSPFFGVSWNVALLLLTILCGTVTMIENWARIFYTIYCRRKSKHSRGRLYPELGKFNYFVAISRFAPFVVLCAGFFVWAAFSPSNVMQRNPRAFSWVS